MPPLGLNLKEQYENMEFGGFVWRHEEHLGKWKELQSPSASRQVTPFSSQLIGQTDLLFTSSQLLPRDHQVFYFCKSQVLNICALYIKSLLDINSPSKSATKNRNCSNHANLCIWERAIKKFYDLPCLKIGHKALIPEGSYLILRRMDCCT